MTHQTILDFDRLTQAQAAPAPPAPDWDDNDRLDILDMLAKAKLEERPRDPIMKELGVNRGHVTNWHRQIKDKKLKPSEARHPHLCRVIVQERMAKARAAITKEDRKKASETRKRRAAPAEAPIKIQKTPSTPPPGDIAHQLEKLATNHDLYEVTVQKCLMIVNEALAT